MSRIPDRIRRAVIDRDMGLCARCGRAGTDVHHRQRRGVSGHEDVRLLVLLCRECHDAVHANPERSREEGAIISSYDTQPWLRPMDTWQGRILLKGTGE